MVQSYCILRVHVHVQTCVLLLAFECLPQSFAHACTSLWCNVYTLLMIKHACLGLKSMIGKLLFASWQVLTLIPGRVPTYETVFMFSHLDDAVSASFMRITLASGAALTVTSDHYVWACQCQACQAKLVSAGKVRQDMCMWVASHDGTVLDRVVATSTIAEYGLYNPHTKSGSILVNNIATSTFTKVLPASLIVHKLVTYPLYLLSKLLHMAQVDEAFNGLILNLHSAVSTARLFEYPRFVHTVLWATPPFQCR